MKIAEQHQEAFAKLLVMLTQYGLTGDTDFMISIANGIFNAHVAPLRETIDKQGGDLTKILNENEVLKLKLAEATKIGKALIADLQKSSNERIKGIQKYKKDLDVTKGQFDKLENGKV